jgi:putative NADH-flavin reductase
MRQQSVLILGPTGGTGRQLVTQTLDAGHVVTAFARRPERLAQRHERLRVIAGSVTDGGSALAEAVRGQDAVISALGRGTSFKAHGLMQQSIPAVLSAMRTHGVRRFIFTSAIGVGETIRDAPLFSRLMMRFLLSDLYADKAAAEAMIRRSGLDWIIVQPVQLTNGPLTGTYRAGERLPLRGIPRISRADVAHFILGQLGESHYIGKTVLLAN